MHLRFVAAVLLAASWGSETRAQDKSATTSAAPAPDAIAGAKKDFESIKSGRDAALLPKGGMPNVNLPPLPAASPTVTIGTKQKIAPPDAKSRNWLIDGIEKQDGSRNSRGQNSRPRDRDDKSISRDDLSDESKQKARQLTGAKEDEEDTPVVINPLASYLGDWMTPQDYALLKPGLSQSFEPGVNAKNPTGLSAPAIAGNVGGVTDFAFGGISSSQPLAAQPVTRENPYLQSLKPDLSSPSIATRSNVVSAPPMRAPIPMVTPPQPIPPPQTKIPEFAKPPTDDRYFKQLKRF